MTKNQIEYAKLIEARRSNLSQEQLTKERDQVNKMIGLGTLDETRRSNQAREVETARHNVEQERLGGRTLDETSRHNLQTEDIARQQVQELNRHNLQTEFVSKGELGVHQGQLQETRRSNVAREVETTRSNVAREVETHRNNAAIEAVQIGLAATQAARLAEDVRQHLARESETARHNMAMEIKPYPETRVTVTNSQNANPTNNYEAADQNVNVGGTKVITNTGDQGSTVVPVSNQGTNWPKNIVEAGQSFYNYVTGNERKSAGNIKSISSSNKKGKSK